MGTDINSETIRPRRYGKNFLYMGKYGFENILANTKLECGNPIYKNFFRN